MTTEEARWFAGAIWADGKNRSKVMDVDLAEAFARVLLREVNRVKPPGVEVDYDRVLREEGVS